MGVRELHCRYLGVRRFSCRVKRRLARRYRTRAPGCGWEGWRADITSPYLCLHRGGSLGTSPCPGPPLWGGSPPRTTAASCSTAESGCRRSPRAISVRIASGKVFAVRVRHKEEHGSGVGTLGRPRQGDSSLPLDLNPAIWVSAPLSRSADRGGRPPPPCPSPR